MTINIFHPTRSFLVSLLLYVSCCTNDLSAAEPKLTNEQLAAKAERLQKLVEEKVLQQHGMIPMFVRANDYKLPTEEDYKGAYQHRHLRGKTEKELGMAPMHVWRAWENTPSNTGFYLRAAAYQYRTTGDPKALEICRRTLAAIKYIYELSIPKGEKGFLTKPYGGVYSNQTSGDQLQCVMWGLIPYREIAPPQDFADINTMTCDFAAHQMQTDYVSLHGYFGRSAEQLRKDQGPKNWKKAVIFLPALYTAWYGSGDTKFTKEINRWYSECEKDKSLSVATDRFKTNGFGGRRNLYLPTLLMEMNPERDELWRSSMLTNYKQGLTGLLPDSTWPAAWSYDSRKGGRKVEVFEDVSGRTGRSVLYAMGCVSAQRWLPEEKMKETARTMLENLDEETFRFIMPLDKDHPLPDPWQVESKMLDCDSLTGWLAAYWEGRFRGYWYNPQSRIQ